MPGTHAKLAPSASKRWMTCTASPPYIAELVEQGIIQEGGKDSIYSLEGLEAHDWAAKALNGLPLKKVPESFRPHIAEYVEVCHECCHEAHPDSIRIVEQKVPLFYAPDETGTVDFAVVRVDNKGRVEAIHIRDLKYGQGVPVDAEENTQLAIYAQSLIEDLATWWGPVEAHTPVSIGIHQPRYHGDDSLKVWELSAGDLNDFCEQIDVTASRITHADSIEELVFAPSYAVCQFCPAKAVCKARLESAFQDFPADVGSLDDFTNLDMPSVESVDPATLVTIWSKRKEILGWLESVEEHLTALAHSGNRVEGTKLVLGRDGNRQWKDESTAVTWLHQHIGGFALKPPQAITPAVAEKLLKAKLDKEELEAAMARLTCRSEGKPTLALESDKRPAVETAAAEFDVITDEEDV